MLQVKNLNIYIQKDNRLLLKDFSLSLNDGDKIALIGEEGNGKSTLLKTLVGALPPLSGGFRFGAHDRAGHTDKGILELLVVADLSLFYLFIKPTHGIPPGLQKQVLKASRVYSLVTRDA